METLLCLFILCIYLFGTGFSHLFYFLWGLAEFEVMCFGESVLIFISFLLMLWVRQSRKAVMRLYHLIIEKQVHK